jgi:four helix bundle protein
VYHEAHALVISIYKETRDFPRDEWFGIRSQLRRAAVSAASNIVEGNARRTTREYVSFLNIARGSTAEVGYLIHLATELGYLSPTSSRSLASANQQLVPQIEALIGRMETLAGEESRTRD